MSHLCLRVGLCRCLHPQLWVLWAPGEGWGSLWGGDGSPKKRVGGPQGGWGSLGGDGGSQGRVGGPKKKDGSSQERDGGVQRG